MVAAKPPPTQNDADLKRKIKFHKIITTRSKSKTAIVSIKETLINFAVYAASPSLIPMPAGVKETKGDKAVAIVMIMDLR